MLQIRMVKLFAVIVLFCLASPSLFTAPASASAEKYFEQAKKRDANLTKRHWRKLGPKAQAEYANHGAGEFIVVLQSLKWGDNSDLPKKSIAEQKIWRAQQRKIVSEKNSKKLAALVRKMKTGDVTLMQRFNYLPVVKLKLNHPHSMSKLLDHADVSSVMVEQYYRTNLVQSLPVINQPAAASGDILGQGVSVAVFDTGLDYTGAPFNCSQAIGTIPTESDSCKVVAEYETAPPDNSLDDDGHGTQVSAVTLGVAPNSGIIAMDVFDVDPVSGSRTASSTDINQAVDILIGIKDQFNVVAANFSLGSNTLYTAECSQVPRPFPFPGQMDNALKAAMDTLLANAILPIAASGNDANSTSISSPACISTALAVGATYDQAFITGRV